MNENLFELYTCKYVCVYKSVSMFVCVCLRVRVRMYVFESSCNLIFVSM